MLYMLCTITLCEVMMPLLLTAKVLSALSDTLKKGNFPVIIITIRNIILSNYHQTITS